MKLSVQRVLHVQTSSSIHIFETVFGARAIVPCAPFGLGVCRFGVLLLRRNKSRTVVHDSTYKYYCTECLSITQNNRTVTSIFGYENICILKNEQGTIALRHDFLKNEIIQLSRKAFSVKRKSNWFHLAGKKTTTKIEYNCVIIRPIRNWSLRSKCSPCLFVLH